MRHTAEARRRDHGFVLNDAPRHIDGHRRYTLVDRRSRTSHSLNEVPERKRRLASSSRFYLDRTFAITWRTASMRLGQPNRRVGVGIMVTHNPLHRSGRAALPHQMCWSTFDA